MAFVNEEILKERYRAHNIKKISLTCDLCQKGAQFNLFFSPKQKVEVESYVYMQIFDMYIGDKYYRENFRKLSSIEFPKELASGKAKILQVIKESLEISNVRLDIDSITDRYYIKRD
ncbi:MAG: hypothetical protein LBJ88_04835 [Campylobacteraceae bacterium]|nr:hypothetical protein [Campylobacteraceae bacterium]